MTIGTEQNPVNENAQIEARRQAAFMRSLQKNLKHMNKGSGDSLKWLQENMPYYFFITMKEDPQAVLNLANQLDQVKQQLKVNLIDEDEQLILARVDRPGSFYDTLRSIRHRKIGYSEMVHSLSPLPDSDEYLEVQKIEFGIKTPQEIADAENVQLPQGLAKRVRRIMKENYPDFDFRRFQEYLRLLWVNNESYVRMSPPLRLARILWLYQQGNQHDGLYLDVEEVEEAEGGRQSGETRVLFAVGNPAQSGFMAQAMEVFSRLDVGVRRLYGLNITTKYHTYFLGTMYVRPHAGGFLEKTSELFEKLKVELYNTQILSPSTASYLKFLAEGVYSGEEASLANTFISFAHTSLAHAHPDRFDLETVKIAFHAHPEMAHTLINLFRARFDPDLKDRDAKYQELLAQTEEAVANYNTGHRHLDEVRREIYRCILVFITHTLKTNFFVPEKHALAFRLDPAYLEALGDQFTGDLPEDRPFRVTFFYGRYGAGYHIGFSDIARGGWRTIICRNQDEWIANSASLFREVYVLAHTQHLKNKDIYEGGSKLTVVCDARNQGSEDEVVSRLYKLQYGMTNAFLDLFVTEGGMAANPRVVDYYGEEEPIEIGPDENMHDAMIEQIAKQAKKRGYVLGIGIMSSKSVGINHKEYGVTSRGVYKFAEIAMADQGVDIHNDSFSVCITGGPYGDVAGNIMNLLLNNSPKARILTITDGMAAVYDPKGIDHKALGEIVLKKDLDALNPEALNPGGFIQYRNQRKTVDMRELFKKVVMTENGLEEKWITSDEYYRELDNLLFRVETDLLLPCGGRPETIDENNCHKLFESGKSSVKVIVEGANSFITPAARTHIQDQGVVLMRDASANKCGVISSSYEIIANLLMTNKEFLKHKEEYVSDVLDILDRRAEDEANLILKRHKDAGGKVRYNDISNNLSRDINRHYARLFDFFQKRSDLAEHPMFKKVILSHLPAMISENVKFRGRIKQLPPKIKFAILAAELATTIVYKGGWDTDLEGRLKSFINASF
ncbi:NAD-glutamate dehydrogenase domain-containing protein [Dethiosulfatarculus sandiegensis]|uniref:Amino acid dehydrogenase n=1 Tax=Dethiosulfatarculus sandiegensis TaxID=1429043 RepID=A0A0D2HQ77_9BACT|nr:NAD-glutamate dehydrogenase domain-containing protein [Dethiosulfatarculus sandiegensis]KIX12628.1 amino acid dehydrogenase [Dethiosulfatarculus sandiegensis]